MENNTELQNSSTSADETLDVNQDSVGQKPPVNVSELESKNRQLFERAKKAEDQAKEYRDKLAALEAKPASAAPKNLEEDVELLKTMAKGYSEEEARFVLRAGGPENPFVKSGIEAMRAKAKVEQAKPSASEIVAPADQPRAESWNKMSLSDRKKTWNDALDRAASRRSGQPI